VASSWFFIVQSSRVFVHVNQIARHRVPAGRPWCVDEKGLSEGTWLWRTVLYSRCMLNFVRHLALYCKGMFVVCQDRAVTCAVMVTLETLQEDLDQFGCAFLVTAIRMLTLMLLVTATEPLESAWSVYTILQVVNVTSVCQVIYQISLCFNIKITWSFRKILHYLLFL